jgi:hypothetical protein
MPKPTDTVLIAALLRAYRWLLLLYPSAFRKTYGQELLEVAADMLRGCRDGRDGPSDHRGSGIGLAISKALIEGHGGPMSAESLGTGQGAGFSFLLPLGRESSKALTKS